MKSNRWSELITYHLVALPVGLIIATQTLFIVAPPGKQKYTTIRVTIEFRDFLDRLARHGESYEKLLCRLLNIDASDPNATDTEPR